MTRPLDLADELAQLVNPLPQQDLDPEAAGLGDGDLLNPAPLDPQLEALLGDTGAAAGAAAAGRRRGVAGDISLQAGEYRNRVSSRAALFGDGEDGAGSSEQDGNSSGDGDDEQQEQQQQQDDEEQQERGRPQFTSPSRLRVVAVSPSRDITRYKTMFVNGHHHPGAPGKDDTTDDSSTDSDGGNHSDDAQQQDEQQQQMNGHHHNEQDLQHQQQQHQQQGCGSIELEQQEDVQASAQQQRQPQVSPAAGGRSDEGFEEQQQPSAAEEDAHQQQQQLQQLGHADAAATGDSSDGEEGSSEDAGSEGADEDGQLAGQQSDGSESDGGEGSEGEEGTDSEQEEPDEMDIDGAAAAAAAAAAGAAAGGGGDSVADCVAAAAAAAAMLGEAAEMKELEREAAAVRAEGEQQLMAAAAAGGDRQAAKAAGVRVQQRLWGNALELRIRLQKAVSGSNRLPRPAAAAAFKSSNKQVAAGYKQLRAACQEALESMLQLHDSLAQQHPAAAAALAAASTARAQQHSTAAATAGSKRSRAAAEMDGDGGSEPGSKFTGACSSAAAAWSAVEGAIEGMAGFRDASLDKWHRRTVLSSGTAALRGSSGLRALQQSISTQVSQLMSADRSKLIARSQLPVQLAPRPLGQPAAAADGQQQQQEGGDEDGGAVRGSDRARDPETYDEGDCYSQLLKELLESAPAGSVPSQLASARPAKRRKVVDRRASKGRKLRFHTMDKLVGFMAPKELVLPPFAEQLFGNLFSHEG